MGIVFLVLGGVVALGALAGCLAPGRGAAPIAITPAVPPLLGAALALQVALRLLPDGLRTCVGTWLVGISALLVVATLALVARPRSPLRPVAVLALVGGGLNAAVMLANGGMPVSVEAAERTGLTPSVLGDDDPTARHVVLDDDSRLPFLADVVPLHVGPERAVFSAGDVVLLAGAACAGFACARRSRSAVGPQTVRRRRRGFDRQARAHAPAGLRGRGSARPRRGGLRRRPSPLSDEYLVPGKPHHVGGLVTMFDRRR